MENLSWMSREQVCTRSLHPRHTKECSRRERCRRHEACATYHTDNGKLGFPFTRVTQIDVSIWLANSGKVGGGGSSSLCSIVWYCHKAPHCSARCWHLTCTIRHMSKDEKGDKLVNGIRANRSSSGIPICDVCRFRIGPGIVLNVSAVTWMRSVATSR